MSETPHDEAPDEPQAQRRGTRAHEAETPPSLETTAASVEALLGLREFELVMPRRRSVAVTRASLAALWRWMRLQGHNSDGHYTIAQWQEFYSAALRYTG